MSTQCASRPSLSYRALDTCHKIARHKSCENNQTADGTKFNSATEGVLENWYPKQAIFRIIVIAKYRKSLVFDAFSAFFNPPRAIEKIKYN
mmetsp:Transcript_4385/g.6574  ORF Transcript_4385/g.6574 Transcript_4385/m.6574 type:complete len:91 (+) Transcript_4385:268-540(+)